MTGTRKMASRIFAKADFNNEGTIRKVQSCDESGLIDTRMAF
jgi:hypothetical protein